MDHGTMERHGIARMRLVQPSGWWCVLLSLFFFLSLFLSSFPLLSLLRTGTDLSSPRPAAVAAAAAAPPGSSLPVRKLLVLPPRGPSFPSWFAARALTHTYAHGVSFVRSFLRFVWFRL